MKSEGDQEVWLQVVASSAELLGADASLLAFVDRVSAAHNISSQTPWQRQLLDASLVSNAPLAWMLPEGSRLADGRESASGMAVRLGTRSGRIGALGVVRSREKEPFGPQDLKRLGALGVLLSLMVESQVSLEGAMGLLVALGEASYATEADDLLGRALEGAARALGASAASVMLLDGAGDLVIRAAWGLPEDVVRRARRRLGEGISGYVAQSGEPLMLSGQVQDPRFRGIDPGIDGAISVPLRGSQGVLGAMNLRRKAVGAAFSPGELKLALGLARALGGAIERVQDSGQVQEDRRQALALYELGRLGREGSEENEVLGDALGMAGDYLGSVVGLVAEKTGDDHWKVLAGRGVASGGEHESRVLGRMLREGRALTVNGAEVVAERCPWWKSDVVYLSVPLEAGESKGVLLLGREGGRAFDSEELGFAEALAVEMGSLWEQMRRRREEGVRVAAGERQRIAQELHDSLAQELSGVLLAIEGSQMAITRDPAAAQRQLAKAVRSARECLRDIRRYMVALRLEDGLQGDTAPQLRRLVEESRRQGLAVDLRVEGERVALQADVQRTVLRVAQETLNNIQKHAQARKVEVTLTLDGEAVELTVEDDGVGFPVADVLDVAVEEGHYGLMGMRERAESVGGRLRVDSKPGQGTRIALLVPLQRPQESPMVSRFPETESEPASVPVDHPVRGGVDEGGPRGLLQRLPALFRK